MNRIASTILAAFLSICFVVLSAKASTNVEERINYYNVQGNSVEELAKNVKKNTPVKEQLAAYYLLRHTWSFDTRKVGPRCRVVDVKMRYRVTIDFPRLVDRGGMPATVREKWERFASKLMAHEREHIRIGKETADRVVGFLSNYSARESCSSLASKAGNEVNRMLEEGKRQNHAYDERTKNGRTEIGGLR